jgi:hypothetical protein
MLTFSQQLYTVWTFIMLKSWLWEVNCSAWYCIQQCHKSWKCCNSSSLAFIVQGSMCLVPPRNVNIWPGGAACCCVCQHLHQFELEGNTSLAWTVTCDEIWVHYFIPVSKQSSIERHLKGSPPPKTLKTQLARSWQVCLGIQNEWVMLIFYRIV